MHLLLTPQVHNQGRHDSLKNLPAIEKKLQANRCWSVSTEPQTTQNATAIKQSEAKFKGVQNLLFYS